jgi:microcystin degradation protein MlrC
LTVLKIAVGGFQHETNTFAPLKADLATFREADAWPGLVQGPELPAAMAGRNIPVAGFLAEAETSGAETLPLCWCSATPSAHVTTEAFEFVSDVLLEGIRRADGLDALYLDLHGAMVTEAHDDGEGELLRRIRAVVGADFPLVVSLDFHANVTQAMVDLASILISYRTYPHVDMAETGVRVARFLIAGEPRPVAKAYRQLPFLIPLTWQCTTMEPMASLMQRTTELESEDVYSVSFAPGFPPADIADCGPAIVAYGKDQQVTDAAADRLYEEIVARAAEFSGEIFSPDEAIARAREVLRKPPGRKTGPVVLADTQDNPGAGGTADTVGLLEALVRNQVEDAVVGLIFDPQVAAAAHDAGEGADIDVELGAKSGFPGAKPLSASFRVARLGDGNFEATGPYYGGGKIRLGAMALLTLDNVKVVVASSKEQAADQAMFRHLGIEPSEHQILALKSSVHFRADFEPIASEVLVVASPGPNVADPSRLPYQNLRAGVRLTPCGSKYS